MELSGWWICRVAKQLLVLGKQLLVLSGSGRSEVVEPVDRQLYKQQAAELPVVCITVCQIRQTLPRNGGR